MLDIYSELKRSGGPYLGVIRSWIQRKFKNGEQVTWGSEDFLPSNGFTVGQFEDLALRIAEGTLRERFSRHERRTIREIHKILSMREHATKEELDSVVDALGLIIKGFEHTNEETQKSIWSIYWQVSERAAKENESK